MTRIVLAEACRSLVAQATLPFAQAGFDEGFTPEVSSSLRAFTWGSAKESTRTRMHIDSEKEKQEDGETQTQR